MPYYSFYIYEQTGIHTSQQGLAGSESQGGRSQNSSERDILQVVHFCLTTYNFCPSELENAIDGWVKYYNEKRFHESLDNLTPKDVYLGQGEKIKKIREIIKQNSIKKRIFDNKTRKYQSK